MVYEPREDSELLSRVVRSAAKGRVLDMGTGSGVQAIAAKENPDVGAVVAVDIDPEAVAAARKAGVDAHRSDLFSAVDGVFDTVVCNAPYLPDERAAPDVALDGGPHGYEWTVRFLSGLADHLSRDGQAFLLVSSRTNFAVVERSLLERGFSWEVVEKRRISFEELRVYRIVFALPDHPAARYLASGKRSRVYKEDDRVFKIADQRRITQEARMLGIVNALGIGPQYFSHEDAVLCIAYVPGERIEEFLSHASRVEALEVLSELVRQARLLDHAGIRKTEFTNPYKHVIVSGQAVTLIDFERARHSPRPQNLSQLREYLVVLDKRFPELRIRPATLVADSFAERVYRAVRSVPVGKVTTYALVARALDSAAYRAVGAALRKNPYAPTVPCHRVIASDGTIGGFMGAVSGEPLDRKRRLLAEEGVRFIDGKVLDGMVVSPTTPR